MTEDQVISIIRAAVDKQFPKTCNVCGVQFNSLKEYLLNTTHNGPPHSFDAEMRNWKPPKPFGTFSFSDCKCGNTLVIGSSGMKISIMWKLLSWARKESSNRNISINFLLDDLRKKIDEKALSE